MPERASFSDMLLLKGKSDVGDQINKKILGPLALANNLADIPEFNDGTVQDRLTILIGIFESTALDFYRNCADGVRLL